MVEDEWDDNDMDMWVESLESPPGCEEYNFDNNEFVQALTRARPSNEAKAKRDRLATTLPPLPQFHRDGF